MLELPWKVVFNKDFKMLTEGAALISWPKVVWNMEVRTLSFSTSLLERRLRGGLWGGSKEVGYQRALPFRQRQYSRIILNWIRFTTGSKCSYFSSGETWSYFLPPNITFAAQCLGQNTHVQHYPKMTYFQKLMIPLQNQIVSGNWTATITGVLPSWKGENFSSRCNNIILWCVQLINQGYLWLNT